MANEHYEAAEEFLSEAAEETNQRYGHYHLARAQAEATLAVAHELHTANLITMGNSVGEAIAGVRKDALDLVRRGELSEDKALSLFEELDKKEKKVKAVQKAVRERMGLA